MRKKTPKNQLIDSVTKMPPFYVWLTTVLFFLIKSLITLIILTVEWCCYDAISITLWSQILKTYINFMYLACNATWYGAGCKYQCGNCINKGDCHHVNGSCLLGCQEGFTGDFCFKRKLCIYNVEKHLLITKPWKTI